MYRLIAVLVLFSISTVAFSQVKVDGKATGKHADAINRAKQTKQTAEQRRVQAEKWKTQLKARELYKQRFDSLKERYTSDSLNIDRRDSLGALAYPGMDSLGVRPFTKEDSLEISRQILAEADFPPEYRDLILNPISFDPEIDTYNADSLALAEASRILEAEAKKFLPDGIGAEGDPMSQFTNPADGLAIPTKPGIQRKPNPNLVKPEQAKKLFEKIDPEQFQEAQADIQKLKKKYSKLPDSRYPEEGTKRNSLENVPFKKRLYFGGNISLQSTDPVIINTNLQLGYWINKKWLSGVGIILREQFANDSTSSLTGDGYGYSLFTRYDIPKGFFAWGEVERQINKSIFSSENPQDAVWQSAYMLGVGREFKIGFVQMMSMILYDFNYKNNDLNARPIVFKLGFRFSKRPGG